MPIVKVMEFIKYRTRGVGYHWEQVSSSLRKRNLFVIARYRVIMNLIGNCKDYKILDVGCGDGVLSYWLAQKGAIVVGVDTSIEALCFAKSKTKAFNNLNFINASAYTLPFESESFDFIVSSEVIEHLDNPSLMLEEIKRVFNGKGRIIITTPIRYVKYPLDKSHYQELFEEDFQLILQRHFNGYDIAIIKSHPLFWFELQNKIALGKLWFRYLLNLFNLLFGFNPFMNNKN